MSALEDRVASAESAVNRDAIDQVTAGRRRRIRHRRAVLALLSLLIGSLFTVSLMVGQTFYSLEEVVRVVLGETVPGASFTVAELRLPRAVLAVLVGAALGLAGVTFQTMLRNPLASPDVIGISAGASVAAVFAIVVLHLSETWTSFWAIVAALLTAGAIYLMAYVDGVAGTRLILVGIGVDAMLSASVLYTIVRASQWDMQTAMRWLTGSLNGATWGQVAPLAIATATLAPLLLGRSRDLGMLQLGDDAATALGTRVERTRLIVVLLAVAILAFATAAAGPIAFVALLCGPIAARLVGGGGSSLLLPSALVGAALVLAADLIGQFAFGVRYPVGVITGALGAPFLVYLLVRTNRTGGSL